MWVGEPEDMVELRNVGSDVLPLLFLRNKNRYIAITDFDPGMTEERFGKVVLELSDQELPPQSQAVVGPSPVPIPDRSLTARGSRAAADEIPDDDDDDDEDAFLADLFPAAPAPATSPQTGPIPEQGPQDQQGLMQQMLLMSQQMAQMQQQFQAQQQH